MSQVNTERNSLSFGKAAQSEFAQKASFPKGVSRRRFLELVGSSLAVAGFAGCARAPREEIVPAVKMPEYAAPGKALRYATILPRGDAAQGVVAVQVDGRPRIIEGSEAHPGSLGGVDAATQAMVLDLYDDRRRKSIRQSGQIRTEEEWLASLRGCRSLLERENGKRFGIVLDAVRSPTLADQIEVLRQLYPELNVYTESRYGDWKLTNGANERIRPLYRFDRARSIVCFDFDFLADREAGPAWMCQFSRVRREYPRDLRLHVIEPAPTLTGGKADHRRSVTPFEIEPLIIALKKALRGEGTSTRWPWLDDLARDLKRAGSESLVIAGSSLSVQAQEAVAECNSLLGAEGGTVAYRKAERLLAFEPNGLSKLSSDLRDKRLEGLLVVGTNLARRAAFNTQEEEALKQDLFRLAWSGRLSSMRDETTGALQWEVPLAHGLESWGDGIAFDGTASLQQPLIQPLFGGTDAISTLGELAGEARKPTYDHVRGYWKNRYRGDDFETFWRDSLYDGVIDQSKVSGMDGSWQAPAFSGQERERGSSFGSEKQGEITTVSNAFMTSDTSFHNPWLQELPHPISKQSWGNAIWIDPAWAKSLEVNAGDWVRVECQGFALEGPALPVSGMAKRTLAIDAGYGRQYRGEGKPLGIDARELERRGKAEVLSVTPLGRREQLAITQPLNIGEEATPSHLRSEVKEKGHVERTSLYPEFRYKGHAWGMTIDLNACTGCSACMIACQSENNIPSVGKDQVAMGREMNWIRLERYFLQEEGSDTRPVFQPVACMHCEKAPCEVVCPVAATTHSNEGINEMTYNRCVGTRYCSNNCPYRARRFNFFDYQRDLSATEKLRFNINVSVRAEGVMEKCTYCIQRIESARIKAIRENRNIRDGDIITACQSACPAEAIVFGDINDSESRVSETLKEETIGLLEEEGTVPRTRYLPVKRNPMGERPKAKEELG